MSNRQLEEMQEEASDRKLAAELGISYEELCELEWDIDTNESDDGLVYSYVVTFSDSSPKDILDKVDGLEDGRVVYLSPSAFSDENE
ncbi:MAG: hypothetical protein D3910_06755 [Candidatus Electrothrix sp. ATG2]|nr:hypothetical protein [Candidatus Electrothrix sp. ATG2]